MFQWLEIIRPSLAIVPCPLDNGLCSAFLSADPGQSQEIHVAVIVVGGHSHNIGKTSVAAGLISEFAGMGCTAMKITRQAPGVCPVNGAGCNCAFPEHPYSVLPEEDRKGNSDTSRFLAAGATLAYWVRVKPDGLEAAVPEIMRIIRHSPFVIIESNSILRYLRPDLYIVVLRFDVGDWKESAREFFERADIAVAAGGDSAQHAWPGVQEEALSRLLLIHAAPPDFVTQELISQVRLRLKTHLKEERPGAS
jgi:hypothetical protein